MEMIIAELGRNGRMRDRGRWERGKRTGERKKRGQGRAGAD